MPSVPDPERVSMETRIAQSVVSAFKQKQAEDEGAVHRKEENVKFAKREQFGSRAVGGARPDDEVLYGQVESADYLTPDTP